MAQKNIDFKTILKNQQKLLFLLLPSSILEKSWETAQKKEERDINQPAESRNTAKPQINPKKKIISFQEYQSTLPIILIIIKSITGKKYSIIRSKSKQTFRKTNSK